ncbi:MAG: hypothetical protein K1W21_06400 [Oscillospiraceae bacterium]
MKPKRSLVSVACELLAVLLITGTAFMWGKGAALAERGYEAIGGEYLLLLLPAMYYTGKQTILDWIADLRELKKGRY